MKKTSGSIGQDRVPQPGRRPIGWDRLLAAMAILTIAASGCGLLGTLEPQERAGSDSVETSTSEVDVAGQPSQAVPSPTQVSTPSPTPTLAPTPTPAGIINVDSLDQEVYPFVVDGDCSLGEAIAAANAGIAFDGCGAGDAQGSLIDLPAGEFVLRDLDQSPNPPPAGMEGTDASIKGGNGLPPVTSRITINGHGATIVRQGSVLFRFFLITEGSLTLNDLSLTGGNVGVEQGYDGGAFAMDMWNPLQPPSLTLNRVIVSGNTANSGGGIMAVSGGLTVNGSTFTHNLAEMSGGAIQVLLGSANVVDSVFDGNEARKVEGGAIGVFLGSLEMTGSLLANNSASGGGGGIYSEAATVSVQGSCFVGNRTTYPQYLGFGSGIHGAAMAANNWWGDESGPTAEGGAGKGDAVTNSVVYEPYLTEAPAFCLSAGSQ